MYFSAKLKDFKIEKCQDWKVPELFSVRMAKSQSWKASELESTYHHRIESEDLKLKDSSKLK